MKKKLGLNRLSDFLEVMQRGANPGLLTSNSLPSLYNMVAIIFKQLFHFKSKCHFKGQEITCIMGYFSANADNCVNLSQPFFPFPNTLLSLIQHYSCYGNDLRFSSKYCCAPGVLFPLISLRFFVFLNHFLLPTTYKIRALSNHFNNQTACQNTKRRFKLVPFKVCATMIASHSMIKGNVDTRFQKERVVNKASRLTDCRAWVRKVSEG